MARLSGLQIERASSWDALRDRVTAAEAAAAAAQAAAAAAEARVPRKKTMAEEVIEAQIGRADAPLTPDRFAALTRAYDILDDAAYHEQLSRALMGRLAVEPQFGELLVAPLAKSAMPEHELLAQAEAAILFARSSLSDCAGVLGRLVQRHPTAFNLLCLGRTLQAAGEIAAAAEVLRDAVQRHPGHLYLVMELASLHARRNEYDRANELLDRVKQEFEEEKNELGALQQEIDQAIDKGLLEKDVKQDIYTEDFVIATWWFYWRSYVSMGEHQNGNVGLDAAIRRAVSKILREDDSITTFIDFGAFCGYTIAKLAEAFPRIRFLGIDRTIGAIDELNRCAFPLPNVEFVGADTLDYVRKAELGGKPVIYHTRTACFCYPEYLRQLYAACRDRGVVQIHCAEGMNFSRTYLRFYPLGSYPRISLAGRGSTFLHDYRRLLEDAGYRIVATLGVQPWLLLDDRSGFGSDHRLFQAVRA